MSEPGGGDNGSWWRLDGDERWAVDAREYQRMIGRCAEAEAHNQRCRARRDKVDTKAATRRKGK